MAKKLHSGIICCIQERLAEKSLLMIWCFYLLHSCCFEVFFNCTCMFVCKTSHPREKWSVHIYTNKMRDRVGFLETDKMLVDMSFRRISIEFEPHLFYYREGPKGEDQLVWTNFWSSVTKLISNIVHTKNCSILKLFSLYMN